MRYLADQESCSVALVHQYQPMVEEETSSIAISQIKGVWLCREKFCSIWVTSKNVDQSLLKITTNLADNNDLNGRA